MGVTDYSIGYHGTGTRFASFNTPEVYLAHERELAQLYAEDGMLLMTVRVTATRPLVFTTALAFRDFWLASGAHEAVGRGWQKRFVQHARDAGYDHVILAASAFEGEDGYEWLCGTFGEPQTIVLDPALVEIVDCVAFSWE